MKSKKAKKTKKSTKETPKTKKTKSKKDEKLLRELRKQKGKQILSEHDKLVVKINVLIKLLKEGLPLPSALKISGITKHQFYNKIAKDPLYSNFYNEITKAKEEYHKFLTQKLYQKIKKGDTKALLFTLERRFHKYWSKKDNFKINTEQKIKQEIDISDNVIKDILDIIKQDKKING